MKKRILSATMASAMVLSGVSAGAVDVNTENTVVNQPVVLAKM